MTVLRAIVDGSIRLPLRSVPRADADRLREKLSFPNPAFRGALARAKMHGYEARASAIPARLAFYEERGGELIMPRGAVSVVRRILPNISFEDRRAVAPARFTLRGDPRPYQAESAHSLARSVQGIGCAPCGAGKTWIGAAAIARIGQRAAVLVNSHDLADQWRATIETALGIVPGDLDDDAAVCVGTLQSLAGREGREGLDRFGLVIVDEAHHVPASTFFAGVPLFPAKYRLGKTATPDRDDGLSKPVQLALGPIVSRIGYEELFAAGWLMPPSIRWVPTPTTIATKNHASALKRICEDAARNELIIRMGEWQMSEERQTLILSARKEHLRYLARRFADRGHPATLLLGDMDQAARRAALERARAGAARLILATADLAAEGLDIPGLESLIIGTPSKARGRAVQTMGRLTRIAPGKKAPALFDLVDAGELPERHAKERRKAYRAALGRRYEERTGEAS